MGGPWGAFLVNFGCFWPILWVSVWKPFKGYMFQFWCFWVVCDIFQGFFLILLNFLILGPGQGLKTGGFGILAQNEFYDFPLSDQVHTTQDTVWHPSE